MSSTTSSTCTVADYLSIRKWDNATKLEDLSTERSRHYGIFITFASLTCVFGLLGNIPLVVVFLKKYTKSSYQIFTVWFASTNIIICVVILPLLIYIYTYGLDFPNEAICKFSVASAVAIVIMCHCILLLIVIERYRKVYHPFDWQVTDRNLNFLIIISILVAVIVAFPHAIFFGKRSFETGIMGINATTCFISDNHKHSTAPRDYYIASNVISIFVVFIITVLCIKIIITINGFKNTFQSHEVFPTESVNPPLFSSTTRTLAMRRSTITLFIATVSIILTTLPITLTIMAVLLISNDLVCHLQYHVDLMYRIFTSMLLSHVIFIPFIYAYFDNQFKYEIKDVICTYTKIRRTRVDDTDAL